MPRKRKYIGNITVDLLTAGVPTRNGRVYPPELIAKLREDIVARPVTIEEVSPVERRAKKVPVCYSWPEHAMADSTGAEVVGGTLRVDFAIRDNRYGKLLDRLVSEGGVSFKPVGIGDCSPDGTVTEYRITYVTFEVPRGQA
jgi:hypothetical protein